jgi:hypothetical protein
MKYTNEIDAFYVWLETNSISDSAIVLWHALMHTCYKAGWITEFAVAISTLESKTGLKKDAIIRARQRLKQLERINFRSREGQLSALYTIIPFENGNCVVLNDTKCDTNRFTNRAQSATQTASINYSIYLSDNKRAYAKNVFLAEEEYVDLVNLQGTNFADACIEKLNNYKCAHGVHYDSDYHAILSWVVEAVRKDNEKILDDMML